MADRRSDSPGGRAISESFGDAAIAGQGSVWNLQQGSPNTHLKLRASDEGAQRINFDLEGRGRFSYSAVLTAFVPAADLTSTTNDWTVARVGNEVVWSVPAGNALEWNTIYNFGFDCDIAPSVGVVTLDEARIGAGALSVQVASVMVPSWLPVASVATMPLPSSNFQCSLTEVDSDTSVVNRVSSDQDDQLPLLSR